MPRQKKQGREGKMPIVSVDGPRHNGKSHKMPEWGLTRNLIDGGFAKSDSLTSNGREIRLSDDP